MPSSCNGKNRANQNQEPQFWTLIRIGGPASHHKHGPSKGSEALQRKHLTPPRRHPEMNPRPTQTQRIQLMFFLRWDCHASMI